MTGVTGGGVTASFGYDGDGNRVRGTVNGVTTVYIGSHYEWTGSASTAKKYYYAGSLRMAVRTGTGNPNFLLGDHLGSTSITANSSGGFVSEVRYLPFGQDRCTSGTTPTTYRFTGQRQEAGLGGPGGLYFFNARWLDPLTGRFASADSIVPEPGDPQSLNRYSYTNGNPLKYTDPSGHAPWDGCEIEGCVSPQPPSPCAAAFGNNACQVASRFVGVAVLGIDILAATVSTVGIGLEIGFGLAGESITPVPAADGAVGVEAGRMIYQAILNPIEDNLSWVATGLNIFNEALLTGDTTLTTVNNGVDLALGPDTSMSVAGLALGNNGVDVLGKEPVVDTLVNGAMVYYDATRLSRGEPPWGLFQVHAVMYYNLQFRFYVARP